MKLKIASLFLLTLATFGCEKVEQVDTVFYNAHFYSRYACQWKK